VLYSDQGFVGVNAVPLVNGDIPTFRAGDVGWEAGKQETRRTGLSVSRTQNVASLILDAPLVSHIAGQAQVDYHAVLGGALEVMQTLDDGEADAIMDVMGNLFQLVGKVPDWKGFG